MAKKYPEYQRQEHTSQGVAPDASDAPDAPDAPTAPAATADLSEDE